MVLWPIALWSMAAVAASPVGEDKTFRDCSRCPEIEVIGAFVMGAGQAARPVTLPFALAVAETTFAQWDACVEDRLCPAIDDDHGWGHGARNPSST